VDGVRRLLATAMVVLQLKLDDLLRHDLEQDDPGRWLLLQFAQHRERIFGALMTG